MKTKEDTISNEELIRKVKQLPEEKLHELYKWLKEKEEEKYMPALYQKNPMVIEAILFDTEYLNAAKVFCKDLCYNPEIDNYCIKTLEGDMVVRNGDYIIKGVAGEFYPCKKAIFEKTYQKVVKFTKHIF